MASIVEFIYFQPTSSERIISAIVCVVFNIYFIIYELYIYYDMMRYPLAEIGNKTYDYYVLYYGFFLKNIRFEEYDVLDLLCRYTRAGVLSIGSGLTISTFFLITKSLL